MKTDLSVFSIFLLNLVSFGSQQLLQQIDEDQTRKAVISFVNGDNYTGDAILVPEGEGTMRYSDGGEYIGHWRGGKRDGQGCFEWADGRKYIGNWKQDVIEGNGTFWTALVGGEEIPMEMEHLRRQMEMRAWVSL
eukprot:GFUD01094703.1.p1 GENE.GFUD01094703.1~~GFUD01094703.1.p1  ORF type:complete len:135 (-),score=33.53 GFUD01094703.1:129-533(-)